MSPAVRKILNLLSSIIHAAFDALIYQLILSVMLLILSESAPAEARIFASGIIIVCFAARSLYGFESLRRPFAVEKSELGRVGVLLVFLNVLFAVTSEYAVPLDAMILSLAAFFGANYTLRYSLRQVLAKKFFRFSSAITA